MHLSVCFPAKTAVRKLTNQYYIFIEGKGYVKVAGKPFLNEYGLDMFTHFDEKEKVYVISEARTGMRFTVGKSLKAASDLLEFQMNKTPFAKIQTKVEEAETKNGLSPRFTEKSASNLDLILNDNYYKALPDHIMGTVSTRTGRYGRTETEVKSDKSVKEIAKDILTVASNGDFQLIIPKPQPWFSADTVTKANEAVIQKTDFENRLREALEKTKEQLRIPPEKKSTRHNIIPFSEVQDTWGPNISEDEKQVWTWYQTGKLFQPTTINNKANGWNQYVIAPEQREAKVKEWVNKGLLGYDGVEYFPANVFYAGNIYARLEALDLNKEKIIETIGQKNYDTQLKRMHEAIPAPIKIAAPAGERLYISPIDPFCKENFITQFADGTQLDMETDLVTAFSVWLETLPQQDFVKGSNPYEITNYFINHERFPSPRRGEDKQQKKLEQIEIKRRSQQDGQALFARFLFEVLAPQDQQLITLKWNKEYNAFREYDYSKIPIGFEMNRYFKGAPVDPRPALWDGVKFLTMNGSGIVAFDVGVGKTMCAILAVAQALYTGQCKRPLIIVPNPTYKKWIGETVGIFNEDGTQKVAGILPQYKDRINDLYNLGAGYGEKLPERLPTDYSITFMSYEGLEQLGFSQKARDQIGAELFKILNQGLTDRDKEKLREGVDKILGGVNANTIANFDELGFDYVVVDEAHNFKNIFTRVKPRVEENGAGHVSDDEEEIIALKTDEDDSNTDETVTETSGGRDPQRGHVQYAVSGGDPSQRGLKLFAACQYILRNNAMRNVTLLTATPFTNSPLEIYSMLALVAYQHLEDRGIVNLVDFFDKFINMETESVWTIKGKAEQRAVIRTFNNRQVLQSIIFSSIIYKTGEESGVLRPKKIVYPLLKDDNGVFLPLKDRVETSLMPTKDQKFWLKEISRFAADTKDNNGNAITPMVPRSYWKKAGFGPERLLGRDLMAISLAKNCTLSPYLMKIGTTNIYSDEKPTYKQFIESSPKLKYVCGCIKTVRDHHLAANEPVSGQVIYMNLATEYFGHIRDYLVEFAGYEKEEIKIITGKTTKNAKEKYKEDFLSGKVKIIIGSSSIQEGIDLQERSTVLYICSLDWNPTSIKQVEGRIHRQGNIYSHVRIVTPMIENSLDVFMFQKLEEKTSRINDIWYRQGRGNVLNLDDFDPKELKEGLMTDPEERVREDIEKKLSNLKIRKAVFDASVKQLTEAQDAITEVQEVKADLLETYAVARAQQEKTLALWDAELKNEKLSKTDFDYYAGRARVLRELLAKEKTDKTIIAVCRRYARDLITENEDNYYSQEKRQGERIVDETDKQLQRMNLLESIQKNLLEPKGLKLGDDLEPVIADNEKEAEKISAEMDRLKSNDYFEAQVKEVNKEMAKRNLLSKPVFERVKEFTRHNHLLSCIDKLHECSAESKEIKVKKTEPAKAAKRIELTPPVDEAKLKRLRIAKAKAQALKLKFLYKPELQAAA